jgi:PAS domain S-box-containing protein
MEERRRNGERRQLSSISKLMEGSDERIEALREIVSHLSSPTEAEAVAKIAAAVAISRVAHTEVVVAADLDMNIIYVNDPRIFGYTSEELIGQQTTILVPETYREAHLSGFKRYVETGKRTLPSWEEVPFVARHKDGYEVHVMVSFDDITVLGHRLIVAVMRKVDDDLSDKVLNQVTDRVMDRIAEKTGDQLNGGRKTSETG